MDTSTVTVDALIGAGMPLIIALINQAHWSAKAKGLVALLACALVVTLTAWLRGQLDLTHWRTTFLVVAGAALAAYHVWWKPSTWAPSIEHATTLSTPSPPPGR